MQQMMAGGTAVVLVSHALDKVKEMSDRVLWLDKGRVQMIGEPKETIAAYKASVR
jgi:ABC-type polysaccharide/polyol phosphate transport system ATPase subunit